MKTEDIDVTTISITDTFRYGGKVFNGLDDLKERCITGYSPQIGKSPFVVQKTKNYPCFDSSDFLYENRYYQAYFLTKNYKKAETICEETKLCSFEFSLKGITEQYPVIDPMSNKSLIEEHHLPFIYYQGEGDLMQIVQDRNAAPWDKIRIEHHEYGFSFPNPFNDPDPAPCLYGPPTDFRDEPPVFDDKEDDPSVLNLPDDIFSW
jgi:hypothetical protein